MQSPYPAFSTPTRIVSGLGVRSTLTDHVHALKAERILLVGDSGLARIGVLDQFEQQLRADDRVGDVITVLAEPNPTIATTERWIADIAEADAQAIVGVGGGSALSLAKGLALGLTNSAPLGEYGGYARAPRPPLPTVAIPTTAGSGAEVSSTLVLYSDQEVGSVAFTGAGYEPDIALLDGELLIGLPHVPMRDAAMDAYSHAFEALWARGASTFSSAAAFEALRLIRTLLPAALADRRPAVLQTLLEASALANIACGNSGLGLVHALTSASSIHVAHGRQNGILLPIIGEFNRPLLSDAARAELDRIDAFYEEIDAPRWFGADELPEDAAEAMVAAAASHPLRSNNIREASDDDLRRLAALATATVGAGARA